MQAWWKLNGHFLRHQNLLEIFVRDLKSFFALNLRFPFQNLFGQRDVGLSLLGIVYRERFVDYFLRGVREPDDFFREPSDRLTKVD